MPENTFNTTTGQTIARELLVAYLNTGSAELPTWSIMGSRVTDSSEEMDWGEETSQDITGNTFTSMKKPIITQSFDPWELSGGDAALEMIWTLAVKEQNAQALVSQDMLIVHLYSGIANTAVFAERYSACMVKPTGLGGAGGGNISMPINVTYGGKRTVGTAALNDGTVTFTTGDAAAVSDETL